VQFAHRRVQVALELFAIYGSGILRRRHDDKCQRAGIHGNGEYAPAWPSKEIL